MISPSDIVRQVLVDAGVVVMPFVPGQLVPPAQIPGDGSTVCFTSSAPDDIDQLVCIYDAAGKLFGRLQKTGRIQQHEGLRFLIRALDFPTGDALVRAVVNALDGFPPRSTVVVDEVPHYVQSIYRTSTPTFVGEETGKKRQLWTLRANVAMQYQEPGS